MKVQFVLALLPLGLLSCSPQPTPLPVQTDTCNATEPAPTDGQPIAKLGKPSSAFSPIVDGDVLKIIFGPQGGQHVYVEVMTYAKVAETWMYRFVVVNSDGARISNTEVPVAVCANGWTRSTAVRVVLDIPQQTDAVLTFSARPMGTPLPDIDAGATGPLDRVVSVKLQ
jgi:hypothetical protein